MPPIGKNKLARGCWTCKDRRVRCDLGHPTCSNCDRIQQVCQGYGVRLSWPRAGDTKRAIVGGISDSVTTVPRCRNIDLVHTSTFDMEMYYYLVDLRSSRIGSIDVTQPAKLILPPPLCSISKSFDAEDLDLLHYFRSTAYSTLATFNVDPTHLREIILGLSFDDTIASRAVLHALLAFSSLHRESFQLQAAQHKTAAVGALGASLKNGIRNATDAAYHVAANMLLCSFEIHLGTDSHSHWPLYLAGARDVAKAAGLEAHISRPDTLELILWVYYHDVLAKFCLLHWRREPISDFLAKQLGVEMEWHRDLCASAIKLNVVIAPLPTILRRLGDVLEALCHDTLSSTPLDTLQRTIHTAESLVKSVPQLCTAAASSKTEAGLDRLAALTELYRTAILVYIARLCASMFGETRDLTHLLDRGFAQIEQMQTCDRLFPVFILGCEADTDERRLLVLNLLRRTEKTHVRSLDCLRRGLDSVWIQDDLHADQDIMLDYMNKLDVIVSSSHTMPTFV
ncbi:fungal-specific transcription factor domain-containing protein [Astrocystis sublimbata]|nr:fungal-specific transcription factor domain-containing protein [Astrocystis sublimbata]